MSASFDAAIRAMRDRALADRQDDLVMLCQIALGIWRPQNRPGFSTIPELRSQSAARARCQEIMQAERERNAARAQEVE